MEGYLQRLVPGAVFLSLLLFAWEPAGAQVLRRDPAEEPAPLVVNGRSYTPDGEINLGLFRFHPFASQGVHWDSNIFLSRHFRQEDDFVFDTAFGVRTDWRMGRHESLLGYQGKYLTYRRHPKENFFEHRLDLLSQWNFDWFFVDVGAGAAQRKDPEPDGEDIISERSQANVDLHGGVYVDRIGFELEYKFTWYDFVDVKMAMLDHNEHSVSLSGYYLLREDSKLTQKLYAFMDVTFKAFRHSERLLSDSNQLTASLGVKGTVFDRLVMMLKLGYGGLDPAGNGTLNDREDFRGLMYMASVMYMPTEEQSVRLTTSRNIQTSAGSNHRVFDRLEGAYEVTFFDNLHLRSMAFLDHSNPSNTRNLTRMGVKFGVEYLLQNWLSVGADYNFTVRYGKRIPGTEALNYRNHKIGLWVTLYI